MSDVLGTSPYMPPAYYQPGSANFNLGAGLSAAGNAVGSFFNLWSQYENRKYNERMTREQWAREDNAVQRRVADLRAAGLSPTLAAGSAADSSAPNRSDAPQIDFDKMNFMAQYYSLLSQKKDLARQDEELNKLKLQNKSLEYTNAYLNPAKFQKIGEEMSNLAARSYAAYGSGSNNYAQAALHSRTMSFLKHLEDNFGWFLPGNYQFSNRGLFKGNLDFGILASSLGMDTIKNLFNPMPYSDVVEFVDKALEKANDALKSAGDWWNRGLEYDPNRPHDY